ncbi:hypothetical protein IL54_3235 [Sphingobium sp. ba1]|nr:hypothetical protein IL54_3235 [Sphingobium sp. ba1]
MDDRPMAEKGDVDRWRLEWPEGA